MIERTAQRQNNRRRAGCRILRLFPGGKMKIQICACFVAMTLAVSSLAWSAGHPARLSGAPVNLGDGPVASYAEFDAAGKPKAIGVAFSRAALASLPKALSDGHRCFDANGDGVIDPATECSAWHERVLPLPSEAARRADLPFKWALINWNPAGHMPPGVFDKPHFDVHFYLEPIENVFAIERGKCGSELVRCDQYAIARKPIPSNYLPANYLDLGIVAPAMGNHYIDPADHNFHGEMFKRHWVYGVYDGRVIFYEEMLTLAYMQSKPDTCYPIATAEAVAVAGYYPTQSCIRYSSTKDEVTVSLEGFVSRTAAPPGPLREAAKDAP
jgi:hypothetical protein